MKNFEFVKLSIENGIATVTLNNPKKTNAMNEKMWFEIGEAFEEINNHPDAKVSVLLSEAKHFSSGIDIRFLDSIMDKLMKMEESEREPELYKQIKYMQSSFNSIENCKTPVIAAIHGICVGGAVDLVAACDMRLSTFNSIFSILETKLGIVADMGTLQRLPRILSDSHLKELALTSKFFSGYRAKKIGLVNKNFLSKSSLHRGAFKLAKQISELPEHAVQGTKTTINFAKDNDVNSSLEQIARLNSHLLLSEQTVQALKTVKDRLSK